MSSTSAPFSRGMYPGTARNAEPGDWPRGYEAQLRTLYLDNAIAQRAVRLVAEGVASAPLITPESALAGLVCATTHGQSLIETLATHLLLHGNAYVEIIRDGTGKPADLFALRPERMTVTLDPRGWPVGFVYRAGNQAMPMGGERIIHIRTHHPLDDHYGLGSLCAAAPAIAIHNAAARWNKALLDNAARPSGALIHDAADGLSADQFDRLKEELAAQYQGATNAGRPMLLEGGLKWQTLSLTPADMDFVGLKSAAARDIALAFGVPPMLLGLPGDATFANYREANKALWRHAILPMAHKILSALVEALGGHYPGDRLTVDLDQVTALSEDRERLWSQVSAADFLSDAEKRALLGLAPPSQDAPPPQDAPPSQDAPQPVDVAPVAPANDNMMQGEDAA
jgi:HK97 family phage portal protein